MHSLEGLKLYIREINNGVVSKINHYILEKKEDELYILSYRESKQNVLKYRKQINELEMWFCEQIDVLDIYDWDQKKFHDSFEWFGRSYYFELDMTINGRIIKCSGGCCPDKWHEFMHLLHKLALYSQEQFY